MIAMMAFAFVCGSVFGVSVAVVVTGGGAR